MQVANGLMDISTTNMVSCSLVLPTIDVYFAAVAEALGNQVVYTTVRPAACGGI